MPVKEYRKKPVKIKAIEFTENTLTECVEFIGKSVKGNFLKTKHKDGTFTCIFPKVSTFYVPESERYLLIETLEGTMKASYGDYIIKGLKGEFYACKPDIFHKSYELVEAK